MDIVSPISLPSVRGHRFILAITDCFSKWAEAIPLREVKTNDVIRFIEHHVIYRYDVPRCIIHDNGTQFVSHAFTRFCDKFRIQNLSSMAYNPSANDLAEAFNKTIVKILTKMTSNSKRDWNVKLDESLWAYLTTVCTPTDITPYSLVYGCEAVLPPEIQILSLRITLVVGMMTEDSYHWCLAELEALDEKRFEAQQHIEFYQALRLSTRKSSADPLRKASWSSLFDDR
uniref:Integrase core domain containing protein n=1 Tax=Asparagus officinalis TaxID=4686 RepID=Q2AA14_ASPOF|nr:Integrase core domain containing protein [Asparagus officinalis]